MIRIITGILCCMCWPVWLAAQDFSHRNYVHSWNNRVEEELSVDTQWASSDAVVLFEEWTIDPEAQTVEVYQRTRFLTPKGIDDYLPLRLPAAPDPYWNSILSHSLLQPAEGARFSAESDIYWIDARLIRNGDIEKVVMSEKPLPLPSPIAGITHWNYTFDFLNLQPGDELEIVYKYRYSGVRFYVPGIFPRQELWVKVDMELPFAFHTEVINAMVKPDTATTFQKRKKIRKSIGYLFRDIAPARLSVNQLPAETLPHIYIYPDRYTEYSGSVFESRPGMRNISWDHYFGRLTRRSDYDLYSEIVEIYDQPTTWINTQCDSLHRASAGDRRLYFYYLQSLLAKYEFRKTVPGREKANYLFEVTDALRDGFLYQEHTVRITEELIFRTRQPFFLGIPADNRVDKIDIRQPREFYGHQTYSVAEVDGAYIFLPLRHSPAPYFANELPFYLEGSSTLLIPRTVDPDVFRYYREQVPYRVITSPEMPAAANSRYTEVHIFTDRNTAGARVELSGQFSTCTRGVYMYNTVDSLVNPQYARRLFNWDNGQMESLFVSAMPPYHCNFSMNGDIQDFIRTRDTLVSVDMSAVFPWITDTSIVPGYPYRADFAGVDSGTAWVRSPLALSCINSGDFLRYYNRPGFAFRCQVSQAGPSTLRLDYVWEVRKKLFSDRETAELRAVFRDMEQLKNTPLLVRQK